MSTEFQVSEFKIAVSGKTDVGLERGHNEDCLSLPEEECLVLVADGMGGHDAGDIASRTAVDSIVDYFRSTVNELAVTWPFMVNHDARGNENRLVIAIQLANQEIFAAARREQRSGGMGTTLVATLFCESGILMGHIGDSRIYRIREGLIEQLTEDHSLLNDYIKMKRIDPDEISDFPYHNVIVRALGMKENVAVDILREGYRVGDTYLLCSDGLSGMITDEVMLSTVQAEETLDQACDALIAQANANGGKDNITVALARVEAG